MSGKTMLLNSLIEITNGYYRVFSNLDILSKKTFDCVNSRCDSVFFDDFVYKRHGHLINNLSRTNQIIIASIDPPPSELIGECLLLESYNTSEGGK